MVTAGAFPMPDKEYHHRLLKAAPQTLGGIEDEESRVHNLAPSEAGPAPRRDVCFAHVEMTDTHARTETPVRQSARQQVDGCWLLSEAEVDYLDGSEDRLLEILRGADDLSSLSDELEKSATNWPERYSLSRSRANILRSLALTSEQTVLEVGAGCGPITRYLGETCGTVDAVEPVRARARVARERTRDLPNVDVYIGSVSDIPAEPAYDVIVVVGVLEYAGRGDREDKPYVDFLSHLRSLLRPGGQIVCAIENRLGVKYLAGAAEDHTNRVFDGIEGYPQGGRARTFSRTELASLFASSSLEPSFYGAFPDFKMTRALFSDELLRAPDWQNLGWLIPWFPSPDWLDPRPHLADERRLWRSLVEDGIGAHFSNSFLVIATATTPSQLWGERDMAFFFNTQRRAIFATQTQLRQGDGSLTMQRSRLLDSAKSASSGGLTLKVSDQGFVEGRDFLELLAESDDEALGRWLRQWSDLVRTGGDSGCIDMVPHNMIADADGELVAIDQEWWLDDFGDGQIIERGVFWLGIHLADRTPPERWGKETVRELTVALGELVGLASDGGWIEGALRRESEIQARVTTTDPGASDWNWAANALQGQLLAKTNRRLADTALGMREHDLRGAAEETIQRIASQQREDERRVAQLKSELGGALDKVEETEQRLIEAEQHAGNLGHDLALIRGSIGYRMLEKARAPVRILAPPGSPQRLPLVAARRAARLARRRGPMALVKKAMRVSEWPAVVRNLKRAAPPAMDLNAQYDIWLSRHSVTPARAARLRSQALALKYQPLVSIVTPVYNPEVSWLRDSIESVRGQVYANWELCLADDGSTKPGVRELMEEYSRLDSRIKVTFAEQNGGISAASNAALSLATGEFVGLLDHDDVLTPDALFEVVKLLNERPELDYVYSDEDKMELDGSRLDPFFKPDWAPDLLNCLNYVTHFSVYRKSILDDVGGFRIGFEGSQDWDLTLRVTERTQRIAHIARPLYSWRKVPGSAAASDRAKDYASVAAKKALSEALDRRGLKATVLDGPYRGYYRVKYEISGAPKVTIVIPTRDHAPMLRRCVDSIRSRSTYANYEIMIINNESREAETLRYLETFEGRVIDYPHQFNYSAQMNLGVQAAGTDYVILLNNDTVVISPDWIEAMLEYGQRPDVGAVGARLFFPDGRVQHEGVLIGCGGGLAGHLDHGGYFGLGECVRNVSAVTAACMLVKTKAYEDVGGLDESLRVAYNDVDFCLKLREKGYEVIYTPYAQLAHHEGGTRGHRHPEKDEQLFRTRWPDYRDPYYNPHFDVDHPFSLKL